MIPLARIGAVFAVVAALASCGAVADPVSVNSAAAENKLSPDMFLNSEDLIIVNGVNKIFQDNVVGLSNEVASVIDGLNKKYPEFVTDLVDYSKKLNELRSKSQNGIVDPVAVRAITDSFKKKYPAEVYVGIFDYGVQASMNVLSGYLTSLSDTISPMLKICFFINDVVPEDVSRESKFKLYYSFAMAARRLFDLNYSNQMLSSAEDILLQGDLADDGLAQGIYMTRAINNYFLGNYATSISIFESAPEYYDEKNDWFVYNKLNLYISYLALDQARAEKVIKEFLSRNYPDEIRKSWAYRIMLALDSSHPSDLIKNAREGAANDRELAERLCEAYYYIGMKYYHMGAVNTAKLYFILSMSQNVYEFLEHEFSAMALHYYFKY